MIPMYSYIQIEFMMLDKYTDLDYNSYSQE